MTSSIAEKWEIQPEQFWLRHGAPEQVVRFDDELGLWHVYGHSEALEIFGDTRTFSSDVVHLFPGPIESSWTEGNLLLMDPPDHRKLRALVSRAFTPKIVAELAPRIAELTHELLDAVAGQDRVELVGDLAYPLPVIVIAELLGVPSSDREMFRHWVDGMFESTDQVSLIDHDGEREREFRARLEQMRPLLDYLGEHAAERRRRPRPDLLTQLVEAEVDGVRLTDDQIVNFANILLIAGHISTTMLLGNTVLCLDAYPGPAARVRTDRSAVPGAIEESLRFLSPFASVARATTAAVEIGGQRVPADQVLMVWLSAANRDGRRFTEPEVFDVDRHPNPHLGFGRGIHFCLGAPLARLEGRIALEILLDRYAELRTDPADPPTFMPSPNMTGVRTLPLRVR